MNERNVETLITAAIDEWGKAFCSKDSERLMALYAPDAVVFDAIPPFSCGVDAMRAKVIECFPHFPDGSTIEVSDLKLSVGAEIASAHFLWHFCGLPTGHPAGRHWLRSSINWRRQADGNWLIVHDHCSAPFDPHSDKVVLSPDSVASADSGSCGERNPVVWFEIYVHDMVRAKAFYGAVFGLSFTRLESPIELWGFPMQQNGYGAGGALARIEGFRTADNSVIVYFSCDDCAVQAAKAVEAGGRLHQAKMSIGQYGFMALVVDSEGNMIGLHSMR